MTVQRYHHTHTLNAAALYKTPKDCTVKSVFLLQLGTFVILPLREYGDEVSVPSYGGVRGGATPEEHFENV